MDSRTEEVVIDTTVHLFLVFDLPFWIDLLKHLY